MAALSYRTKRALPWPVRIVEIPGYDTCACCGTHVAATGEIGLIKLFSAIPFRGGTRMEMACGVPALALLNQVFEQNRQVSRLLSAQITQPGKAVEKQLSTLESWKTKALNLEKQSLLSRVDAFRGAGDCFTFGGDLSPDGLRELTDVTKDFYPGWDGERYARLVRQFSLDENKRVCGLSEGMKVKYQLAVAMSHKAELLILDEPFNFLDPSGQNILKKLLLSYHASSQATILISSHNLQHTVEISSRVALMETGRIIEDINNRDGNAGKALEEYFMV